MSLTLTRSLAHLPIKRKLYHSKKYIIPNLQQIHSLLITTDYRGSLNDYDSYVYVPSIKIIMVQHAH